MAQDVPARHRNNMSSEALSPMACQKGQPLQDITRDQDEITVVSMNMVMEPQRIHKKL